MKVFVKLLGGIAIITTCIASFMNADERKVDRESTTKAINRFKRVPSEDEPGKLIRYLKGQNAILEKQLAECRAKLRASEARCGSNVPTEENPHRGIEVPIRRPHPALLDPLHVPEPLENTDYFLLPRTRLDQR